MSRIEEAGVRRIAALAGLEADDGEVRRLAREIAGILTRFEELEGAEDRERRHGGGESTWEEPGGDEDRRIRPQTDVPGSDPLGRKPREMAPRWRDGFFVVPRMRAPGP